MIVPICVYIKENICLEIGLVIKDVSCKVECHIKYSVLMDFVLLLTLVLKLVLNKNQVMGPD